MRNICRRLPEEVSLDDGGGGGHPQDVLPALLALLKGDTVRGSTWGPGEVGCVLHDASEPLEVPALELPYLSCVL